MRSVLTFIAGLVCLGATAQSIEDVVRIGTEDLQGTARFQAMGGAFGALGGDLSAIGINPAGSAVFSSSQFAISGTNFNRDNAALFGATTQISERNFADINQAGGVFVFDSNDEGPWKKIALAFNYDIVSNFDDDVFASGTTTEGLDQYFLNFAQGTPFQNILLQEGEFIEDGYLRIGEQFGFGAQQAFLGFFGGVIDPADPNDLNNTSYLSNAQYSSLTQRFEQLTNGNNSKFTANLSGQYEENLYLGAGLNFHSVLFERITRLDESGFDAASTIQSTFFDNFIRTEGTGFSFNAGAIAKLNDNIRVGGSYQSPTWYRFTDDVAQRVNSDLADADIDFIDFNVLNLFEAYRIRIPSKLTGSLAVIFGKNGLLSFDYSYQDMSQAQLGPTGDPVFAQENDFIANQLGAVNTFRVGGEYRINQFSLRGGYRFEESPYEDGTLVGDLEGYSGGIGYDFGGSKLDLAVNRTERDTNEFIFSSGLNSSALVSRTNTNVSLTYTLKF